MGHYSDFYHQADADARLKRARIALKAAEDALTNAAGFLIPDAIEALDAAQAEVVAAEADVDIWRR